MYEGWWLMDDVNDGWRLIIIGNLSDWGDLKILRDDKINKCYLSLKFCRNCFML